MQLHQRVKMCAREGKAIQMPTFMFLGLKPVRFIMNPVMQREAPRENSTLNHVRCI